VDPDVSGRWQDKIVDYKIIEFDNQIAFRAWMESHSAITNGIWLRIYKKGSGITSINYAEALDEALCFGWIDGQKKSYDDVSFLQKFTPRRSRSMWSKRNIEHIERLTSAGLMTKAGLHEVKEAKSDGRWAVAYDAPTTMKVPEYFLKELHKHPKAEAFFNELNKTNKYAIAWRLQTAKTDVTRMRRVEKIIAMLDSGEKLH
jgi:uncharacterized protein YdeI (YjbR/CyaY-like superfamily)